jgi:hypothetical protein
VTQSLNPNPQPGLSNQGACKTSIQREDSQHHMYMRLALRRLAADIEYFEALARMYQTSGDKELARLALSALRSVRRLHEVSTDAKQHSARGRAATRRVLKAA